MNRNLFTEIKVKSILTIENNHNTYVLDIGSPFEKTRIVVNNKTCFYLNSYSVKSFISSLLTDRYKEISKVCEINLNYQNSTQKEIYTSPFIRIYSDSEIEFPIKFEELESFIQHNDMLEVLGYVDDIAHREDKELTVIDLLKNKTNDYSIYEKFINFFIKHDVNKTDFSNFDIQNFPKPVTIVIPAHNSENTLSRTLFCLDNQKIFDSFYNTLKIYIIDDHSENSIDDKKLLSELKRIKDLTVIRTSKIMYQGQSRNLGYINIDDGIIMSFDSDVLPQSNHLINHVARMHLYMNMITCSTRDNVEDNELFSYENLSTNYKTLIPNYKHDTPYKASYPADYLGGPGYPFTVKAFKETNYYRDFGYNKSLISGIDLSLMLKGHNFSMTVECIRSANYSAKFLNSGWGDDDATLGKKAIAAGSFLVPVIATGVFHLKHPPRNQTSEDAKLDALKKNVLLRRERLNEPFYKHIN